MAPAADDLFGPYPKLADVMLDFLGFGPHVDDLTALVIEPRSQYLASH
jgi:hypothetical protein